MEKDYVWCVSFTDTQDHVEAPSLIVGSLDEASSYLKGLGYERGEWGCLGSFTYLSYAKNEPHSISYAQVYAIRSMEKQVTKDPGNPKHEVKQLRRANRELHERIEKLKGELGDEQHKVYIERLKRRVSNYDRDKYNKMLLELNEAFPEVYKMATKYVWKD